MLREITALEDENQDQISLYITQKTEFTAGLHMLIDQIDSVLQKDDECCKEMGFQIVKTPRFYLTGWKCQWTSSEKHQKNTKNA